jgi:hypothetical protein
MSPCLGLLPATAEPSDHPHPLTTFDHFRDNAFCSAALATKSEFLSSAIPFIHLLDPDVDRSMAEFEECRLEWSWILIGTSDGGGRDFESVQAS